jgi:excisionase family DNA binding protein
VTNSPISPLNALTVDQTANLAGLSPWTVERWMEYGGLRFSSFGRRRYVDRDDLDRFLRAEGPMGIRHEDGKSHVETSG